MAQTVDLVSVVCPTHERKRLTLEAIAAGKDVLVDKPCALTPPSGDARVAEAQACATSWTLSCAHLSTSRDQFHTPRNILTAMVGEVGELAECFQWKGEVARGLPEFSAKEKVHVGEEMSDVFVYLVRLADVCGVDLESAITRKIDLNAKKYPADKARGSSAKYTAYQNKD
ncbi:hypothetical protein JL722_14398 [Aureococcus anophagefferens]|nr:hypothetical protein JL722_14398 [Aureococcus anophagefferens]